MTEQITRGLQVGDFVTPVHFSGVGGVYKIEEVLPLGRIRMRHVTDGVLVRRYDYDVRLATDDEIKEAS